jgi:uncharacterized membrane protein YeaQ/YmgE (transglycosylase-associated protein family)
MQKNLPYWSRDTFNALEARRYAGSSLAGEGGYTFSPGLCVGDPTVTAPGFKIGELGRNQPTVRKTIENLAPAFGARQNISKPGKVNNMFILIWLVVGLIAGYLAKFVVPGEGPGGVIGDLVVGVVGALLGGWIFGLFGHAGVTGINVYSIVVAFIGAVVLLFIARMVSGRRSGV